MILARVPSGSIHPAAVAWAVALGAVVGSFLNVVIARVPAGQSIVHPRSRCPRCAAPIAWYDNVPVLSWILLRARCRRCRARIPVRYPLVEVIGAGVAVAALLRHGFSPAALAELVFVALVVALAFIDLDTWLLPHALTWPLLALGLAAGAAGLSRAATWQSAALGAGVGFAVFAAVSWGGEKLLRREALGFGDVWLLSGLGAWLGVGAILPIVLLASVQGSAVGIALVLAGRAHPGPAERAAGAGGDAAREAAREAPPPAADDDWTPPRHAVPFGPFLAAGALEWLYLSERIAQLAPALDAFR